MELCKSFHYGGVSKQKYAKVSVLIADDSKQTGNINEIKGIVDQFNQKGLATHYFGQHEQLEQIDRLGETIKQQLSHVIGNLDRSSLYHKGASITRNIAYLKLNELQKKERNLIFYFIDSDQEFKINTNAENRNREVYAINYLYYLEQIFSRTDSQILTGKVVGDPPVSPSVMAGKFLEDVIGFLSQIAKLEPGHRCQFHTKEVHPSDDAAYHDMADLFGFKPAVGSFHYRCTITGEHNHLECLTHFSGKLNRFFDGEHPTRHTYYQHSDIFASIKPARTLYTGNYAFKPACLKFFIPFAPLKLRMAGPTLGRLMKAEIKERFVSANLPMLHKRTVEKIGQSEFRPGINREQNSIDLSGEFERQFFGDIMLFSVEKLTELGFPRTPVSRDSVVQTEMATEQEMHRKYLATRSQIMRKLALFRSLFEGEEHWWNASSGAAEAKTGFTSFIRNMEYNFGDGAAGYGLIDSGAHKRNRLDEIVDAISHYLDDRNAWEAVLTE